MASKTIFLAPKFRHYAPNQPDSLLFPTIKLGSLIPYANFPEHSIGHRLPLDMTNYNMSFKTLRGGSIDHTDTSSLSFTQDLLVQAIDLVGAERDVDTKKSNKLVAVMDTRVETISPNQAYLKASIQQSHIQSWLKAQAPGNHAQIFMICGILIAQPAEDGPTAQNPVDSAVAAGTGYGEEFGLDFVTRKPFVYGYTLRKCSYSRNVGSSKRYIEGAQMCDSRTAVPKESLENQEPGAESSVPKVDLESLVDAAM